MIKRVGDFCAYELRNGKVYVTYCWDTCWDRGFEMSLKELKELRSLIDELIKRFDGG